jgi:hypothetical protein
LRLGKKIDPADHEADGTKSVDTNTDWMVGITHLYTENLKRSYRLGDLGIDDRIALKLSIKKM